MHNQQGQGRNGFFGRSALAKLVVLAVALTQTIWSALCSGSVKIYWLARLLAFFSCKQRDRHVYFFHCNTPDRLHRFTRSIRRKSRTCANSVESRSERKFGKIFFRKLIGRFLTGSRPLQYCGRSPHSAL